jgi:D-serine deaminase-like pyridoxal phosphate-dependent protein
MSAEAAAPTTTTLSWEEARRALEGERLPAAVVDLDAFDRNLARIVEGLAGRGTPLRVATKSVRVTALLKRLLARGGAALRGLMCFDPHEAAHLAAAGLDDLLVAYPVFRAADGLARLAARGTTVRAAVDSVEGVARLAAAAARAGTRIGAIVCVDMSWRLLGGRLHVGVRRSPLHGPDDVVALARRIADSPSLSFDGLLCYEAQVAGLGDDNPFLGAAKNLAFAAVKRASMRELAARRVAIVRALVEAGLPPAIVNGGGTGSLDATTAGTGVTEVTAGSGFYKPHLFDYYRAPHMRALEPSLYLAVEVTRRPADDLVTCAGGGVVASGAAGVDRLPRPWLPSGIELLEAEGAGEVQTPMRLGPTTPSLAIGDPVLLRPAKAGEPLERFAEVLLVSGGRIVERAPTYRGEGLTAL